MILLIYQRLKGELKFEPRYSLKQGLKKFVEWGETQEAIDMFEKAEEERRKYLT